MTTRLEEYTVGQLARISGTSVRTLHHYDQIGLLKPAHIATNGYRLYRRAETLRLQEILFYRDIGLSLAEIGALLAGPGDALARLTHHRARLADEMQKKRQAMATLDATIAFLKGEKDMALEELYTPFTAEKQAEYERWLIDNYGSGMADAIGSSKQAIADLPEGLTGAMDALRGVETRLVAAFEAGQTAEDAADALEDHRALIARLWGRDCPPEAFAGLAEIYASHPDFIARFEALSPRFSGWLIAAMKDHAARMTARL